MMRALALRAKVTHGLLAILFASSPAWAQKAPTKAIGKPIVELEEPFTGAFDARELPDGRLIVLDVKDNVLSYVSADLSTVKPIARQGSGPTEYQRITQIIPRQGDSTLAYDVMNARFLVIDPNGVAVSTVSLREASGGMPIGPMAVKGYDGKGRLLYQGMKVTMGPRGPALSDTSAVLRLDPARKKIDTLSSVRIGSPALQMSGDMRKGTGAVRMVMPAYPIVDEWGLLPDGRIVVVRGDTYSLEFISAPGVIASRVKVPYEPVKVVNQDKVKMREAREEMEKEVSKAMAGASAMIPKGKSAPKMPSMAVDEPTEWPAVKPAFGQAALKIAPDGEIWISRLREAAFDGQSWDVFTKAGVLRMRVDLPAKAKLVGIGARHIYAVRTDSDDLQYLGRYLKP
ncbi:MAG: hypothetical protein H7066_12490 [Cytophagaceae bacterium]|nr:hypothetical protein [Gemmatimonadaceae bacterium]